MFGRDERNGRRRMVGCSMLKLVVSVLERLWVSWTVFVKVFWSNLLGFFFWRGFFWIWWILDGDIHDDAQRSLSLRNRTFVSMSCHTFVRCFGLQQCRV